MTWKAGRRERFVSRGQVLDALIAYGWIDGRRMKLDEERTKQLISPRRQQIWAKRYRDRARRLQDEGRMRPAALAAFEAARASGTFDALRAVDALEEPPDLVEALEQAGGSAWWAGAAPSYRRNILRWIAGAKGRDTRLKRLRTTTELAAQGHC